MMNILDMGKIGAGASIRALAADAGMDNRTLAVYVAKHRYALGIPYVYHKWDDAELEQIRALITQGHRIRWIARRLSLSENCLRLALYRRFGALRGLQQTAIEKNQQFG